MNVGDKWAAKFSDYDAANPQVWEMFKRFAFETLNAGRRHLSSNLILYRIRYETTITTTDDDPYKVNSAYGPSYARKFARLYPEHADTFEFRTRVAA